MLGIAASIRGGVGIGRRLSFAIRKCVFFSSPLLCIMFFSLIIMFFLFSVTAIYLCRESLTWYRNLLVQNQSDSFNYTPPVVCCFLWAQRPGVVLENFARHMSTASLELRTDNDFVRFSITKDGYSAKEKKSMKKVPRYVKMSKKAKLNELRFYRLKAKKKMNSPNPEVRIRYKLEKVGPFFYFTFFQAGLACS